MPWPLWQRPPLRLLIDLEAILLGIAAIASLSPLSMLRPRALVSLPPGFFHLNLGGMPLLISWGGLFCIALLGLMGRWLPLGASPVLKDLQADTVAADIVAAEPGEIAQPRPQRGTIWLPSLYTAAGFGVSWLAILLGGRGATVFPPLLLLVVIRGCLLFSGRGRIGVAIVAYGSFLAMQLLGLWQLRPLGVPITRLPFPSGARRLPPEVVRGLALNSMVNASLLFALVLGFVLLLVGAVLAEKASQRALSQVNQQLRRYSLRIEDQATLQERNRIAREIHDSVGHCLTAQSIQLENVALQLCQNPERAQQHLEESRRLGRQALQNVRQSVASLRSHPFQGQSLQQALAQLLEDFQRNAQIRVEAAVSLDQPLPRDISIVLYRVIQEALTNAAKHGQAQTIHLELCQRGGRIQLYFSDDGQGFDPSHNTTGFGLQSMAERIGAVAGHLTLRSAPGQGCQLQAEIPLLAQGNWASSV